MFSNKILIIDDSKINHEILKDIISSNYEILEAYNGQEGLSIIQRNKDEITLILLDIVMPVMGGLDVLSNLKQTATTDEIPVMIISSETDTDQMSRAYDLGAIDFIQRPFNPEIVMRRIQNTIALYSKKRNLEEFVVKQFFEKERNNQTMIEVLANIVEFRNGESGTHVVHIHAFTNIILHTLKNLVPQYNISPEMITDISNASALHDIGKISIPSKILNKPGRLTDEEFDIIKSHAAKGSTILENTEAYEKSSFLKTARDICRWHHERWDGKGYPDGLKGNEIPLSAQVVALADVYDALTSKRCYKDAIPHEKAIQMILNGECGNFNPDLLECLKILSPELKNGLDEEYLSKIELEEISATAMNLMSNLDSITSVLF